MYSWPMKSSSAKRNTSALRSSKMLPFLSRRPDEDVQLIPQLLSAVDLDAVDTSAAFLGRTLPPIFISSMPGGQPDVAVVKSQGHSRRARLEPSLPGSGALRHGLYRWFCPSLH